MSTYIFIVILGEILKLLSYNLLSRYINLEKSDLGYQNDFKKL